jgi:hypothetical protein
MRQSRFTETEIIYAVKHVELGTPVHWEWVIVSLGLAAGVWDLV